MHPALDQLRRLQEVDGEIHRLQEELSRYPQLRKAREDEVARAQKQLDEAEEQRKNLELRIRQSEEEVQEWRQEIAKLNVQLSNVKNQKEYEAVNHEIDQLNARISEADEKGLAFLEEEEALDEKITRIQKDLDYKAGECRKELERVNEREAEKKPMLENRLELRQDLAAEVDPAVLRRYDRLNTQFPGQALAAIENGNCGGCHLRLQARTIQDVEQGELTHCTSCQRFLAF